MSCGTHIIKTVFVVGDISSKIISQISSRESIRVLHYTDKNSTISEDENYKIITGSLDNRYFIQALFLQYDFISIVIDNNTPKGLLPLITKEQWEDEYNERDYLIVDGGKIYKELVFSDNLEIKDISLSKFSEILSIEI